MRLGFQLLLAPLFLWGFLLAEGRAGAAALLAFLSLHLFLYPGATAFNSAYDRDDGPVSGLAEPPPHPPRLLPFSLALQFAGAVLAAAVGAAFLLLYLLLALIFAAYSHPAIRLKARPLPSALAIFFGQGALGFAAGWAAATGRLPPLSDHDAQVGIYVAAWTALGLYPSTQIFQIEEDEGRGDRTLAVVLGPARALSLGATCLVFAGIGAVWLMLPQSQLAAILVGAGFGAVVLRHMLFTGSIARRRPSRDRLYRWATRTRLAATAGFLAFLAWRLLA
jgi:1,4-dihydroxy-2-naphthoate octaprenyltransferase